MHVSIFETKNHSCAFMILSHIDLLQYGAIKNGRPKNSIHDRTRQFSRDSLRANMWLSVRNAAAGLPNRLVPTLLKDNIRLFTTPDPRDVGVLYMREHAFYNKQLEPEYAFSVSDEVYQQMMDEVNDANTLPFGLYFCCHGGDMAHTGAAHGDDVEIQVAWVLLSIMFTSMMILVLAFPWPDNVDE